MTRAPEIPVRHANQPSRTKVKIAEYILTIFVTLAIVAMVAFTIWVPQLLWFWLLCSVVGTLFWAIITVEKDTWKDLR